MTTKFWLMLIGVGVIILLVSLIVVYYRGKKAGAATVKPTVTQYDQTAVDAVKKKIAEAETQIEFLHNSNPYIYGHLISLNILPR